MENYTQLIHSFGTRINSIDSIISAYYSTGIVLSTCIKIKQTDYTRG